MTRVAICFSGYVLIYPHPARGSHPSSALTLHSAGFILAAPAALVGTAFFVAVAAVTFHTRVFPRATAWIAVVGGVLNVGALGGIFTLEGPLNSGNGSVAGIAGPVGILITWTLAVSASWLKGDSSELTAAPDETRKRKATRDAPKGAGPTAQERVG